MWDRSSITKVRFITWMAVRNKLKTKDNIMHINFLEEDECHICCLGFDESVHHIFLIALSVFNA